MTTTRPSDEDDKAGPDGAGGGPDGGGGGTITATRAAGAGGAQEEDGGANAVNEEHGGGGAEPPPATMNRRRSSAASVRLYGPPVSQRRGRPGLLQSEVAKRRQSQVVQMILAGGAAAADLEALAEQQEEEDEAGAMVEVPLLDEEEERQQQEEEDQRRAARRRLSTIPTDTKETLYAPTVQEECALLQKVVDQAPSDPAQLVQVTLENVSYHVPVQLDRPTKRTVVNQSLCYFTYEFFRRLGAYLRRLCSSSSGDGDGDGTGGTKYAVQQFRELFVPFEKKEVLHGIHLVLRPGRTYLVLGPPGCGKTTLLQAVAGRLPHQVHRVTGEPLPTKPHKTGRVAYNGVDPDDAANADDRLVLPNIASFVEQLDVHAPLLTVRETFAFAAACRREGAVESSGGGGASKGGGAGGTGTTTVEDGGDRNDDAGDDDDEEEEAQAGGGGAAKNSHATEASENLTIAGLGLAHVQDTFVGNNQVRGVSGGQRRRVTLGEMMQGATRVACGDEISTGLDAAVTYDICQSIVNYSKASKTTRIVSLLQPGPETFALFDEVIVLAEGYLAYAGPVSDVVEYFESLGYSMPATMDVADYIQSLTTPDGALLFDPDRSLFDSHLTAEEFGQAFEQSRHGQVIQELLKAPSPHSWAVVEDGNGDGNNESDRSGSGVSSSLGLGGSNYKSKVPPQFQKEFQHSWYRSFKLNFDRHLLLWRRDKSAIIGKIFENVGMAAATGGILFGRANVPADLYDVTEWTKDLATQLQTVEDGVYGALFMTCLHLLLGTTTSTPADIDERPIHYKHGDANFYHTSAMVVARLAASLPMRAIEILAFGIPVYWMVGLDASASAFFLYLVILLTYAFALKMLYGIIAQILPNKQNVLSFGTFLVLLFSLFGGFIVYPEVIPGYYQWLYWSNPMSWAFQALLLNEFRSEKYTRAETTNLVSELTLRSRGFETDRKFIGWTFVFFIPYMIVCAGVLSFVLKKVRLEPTRSNPRKKDSNVDNDEEDSGSSDKFDLPFVPVDLTFEDVVYEVKASTGDETIRILNGVSGVLRPGRMCALMGSSGAGKTTLMDVVALRKTSGTITGDVRMNGFPQERTSFLRSSGYVEQFDVQQAEITVRETVVFSAHLRLSRDNPLTSTAKGRLQYVDYVLDMMELRDIENLPVGSYEEGGLTFEQRKRLAIAVELAASPSVIFLDEPTSGLDARGALVIMRAMKRIADTGRTVCATIHQPSAAVFEMFHDLLLLKRGGEVVFFGDLGTESCNLVEYFEKRGVEPIQHGENPAAWMLRAYTQEGDETNWKEEFEQSEQYRGMKEDLSAIRESPESEKKIEYDQIFAASRQTQLSLMIRRVFNIMARAPSYNLARLMIAIIYAVLLGTVFLQTKSTEKVFQQHQVDGVLGAIFLGLIIIGVVSISMAVPVMNQIRDVFYKHRASGMLDHNSVTAAVTIAETPYLFMMSALFSAVFYGLVGLFDSVNNWFWFFFLFGLNMATYTYFGQAFICLVRDANTAAALVGALIGFNVFFSGLVVRPQYFVGPFLIGFWTAPGRFAYEAIIVTQFADLNNTVVATPLTPYFYSLGCTEDDLEDDLFTCEGTMDNYVDFFFGGKFTRKHLPIDLAVLFFCLFLARLLCWLSLWKLNYVNT